VNIQTAPLRWGRTTDLRHGRLKAAAKRRFRLSVWGGNQGYPETTPQGTTFEVFI
jgi:hypothetical protein